MEVRVKAVEKSDEEDEVMEEKKKMKEIEED